MIQLKPMNDATVSDARGQHNPPWLVLFHRLPPEPAYLRVKVRRRLERIGAILLKNSVYVLPNTEEAHEDLEWLVREIASEGGDAVVCAARFIVGMTDEEVAAMFGESPEEGPGSATGTTALPRGRTWVTRRGVGVDRIASAWLIRRFIDPEARFKFVPSRGYEPAAGELRFDMFEAEFTHEGSRCTFETLLSRFHIDDPALTAIAEVVHDLDCKDERFGRPEAAGIGIMIDDLRRVTSDDNERITRGAGLMESLYRSFGRRSP